MQSLTVKLVIAFAFVCFVEAVLVAFLVREATQRSFDTFLREEAIESFEQDIRGYYEETGTWIGVRDGLRQNNRNRPGGMRPPEQGSRAEPRGGGERRQPPPAGGNRQSPPAGGNRQSPPPEGSRPPPAGVSRQSPPTDGRRQPPSAGGRNSGSSPVNTPKFGLADLDGVVLLSNGVHEEGASVPASELEGSVPFYVEGRLVAYMLLPDAPIAPGQRAQEYLNRVDRFLLAASLSVLVLAIGLGIWLARGYTKPIKSLTVAASALAAGELGKQVPVQSSDEVGELTRSFNRMSAQLHDISEQRRRLTSDISHDLRTPLTVLSGYLEALRNEELKPTPERFEVMYQEARHLSRLIEDLRMLALVEAGELSLHRQSTEVAVLLDRVRTSFQHQAKKGELELLMQCASDMPALHVDPDRILQVLSNLVANALRYTRAGGRITIAGSFDETSVQIEVKDTGEGIAADVLPHVFDRFYRADSARTRKKGETGLGLAIVKSLVEAHDGTVSVRSVEGEGTIFTLRFPHP